MEKTSIEKRSNIIFTKKTTKLVTAANKLNIRSSTVGYIVMKFKNVTGKRR